MAREKYSSVEEYLSSLSGESLKRVDQIRSKIFELVPGCTERISYNIPAYFLDSKLIIYYSGYENHVSIYPGRTGSKEYTELAKEYASGKSTLKFPNTKPLPMDIIEAFIKLRIDEVNLAKK